MTDQAVSRRDALEALIAAVEADREEVMQFARDAISKKRAKAAREAGLVADGLDIALKRARACWNRRTDTCR